MISSGSVWSGLERLTQENAWQKGRSAFPLAKKKAIRSLLSQRVEKRRKKPRKRWSPEKTVLRLELARINRKHGRHALRRHENNSPVHHSLKFFFISMTWGTSKSDEIFRH